MTSTFEERVRVVLEAQAAAVNVTEILPEVTSLSSEREGRRRRATSRTVTALVAAAAVVAGVVYVANDGDNPDRISVTTSWGYPISAPPELVGHYELASTPDGYTAPDTWSDQLVCTRWTGGGESGADCTEVQGEVMASYARPDDSAIMVTTYRDPNGVYPELLAAAAAESEQLTVRGRTAQLFVNEPEPGSEYHYSTLFWSESDDVVVSVTYSGAADGAPDDDTLASLAENVRWNDGDGAQVSLQIGELAADETSYIVGIGGTQADPCVVIVGTGADCESLEVASSEPFTLLDTRAEPLPTIGVVAIGAVDESIRQVRAEGGADELIVVDTIDLPGHERRFFVVPAREGVVSQRLVFLDGAGDEVERVDL